MSMLTTVVARNPVINVAVKALAADNPTWKIDESETLEDFQFMLTNPGMLIDGSISRNS